MPRVPFGVRAVGDVVETRFGKIFCTSWAMKPTCVVEPSEGSSQLKVTGFSCAMSASVVEASSD